MASQISQGILWKLLSCACFAGLNGIVRYISTPDLIGSPHILPPYVIIFFQNFFGLICLLPFWTHKQTLAFYSKDYRLEGIRVLFAVFGVGLWYLALRYMPITEVVALSFTGPVFTVFGASFFLKEKLTSFKVIAFLLALCGAFFIQKPYQLFSSSGGFHWYYTYPLLAAVCFASTKLITRSLAQKGEPADVLTTYLLIFLTPASFLLACVEWQTPTLTTLPWLFGLGLLSTLAHYSFNKAYAYLEVTLLMPIGFSKLVFSMLIGYLAFYEVPLSFFSWIGMAAILVSVMMLPKPLAKKT